MSRIRSKNTKPEVEVRSTLHRMGYRYVLHKRGLPGTPDLVFPARAKVLFVHGCYWHGHTCKYGKAQSKSNVEFWQQKIDTNRRRDRRNLRKLRAAGWSVATVWECQIKQRKWLDRIVRFLEG
ncbi:very short patch repair endonuclease [Ralstonia sp. SET104]|uniref:very short patch repair endonuclease n=1 Tax=Ralstonia sp. SET104 TaxID=2448774 RepID=UPI000F58DC32|nr:very short patch repair endonuclease [Ralstonia sp. SET104]